MRLIKRIFKMNFQEKIKCTLVKITSKGNRISFVFSNSGCRNPPMRTVDIKIGDEKRSLFEIYSFKILGFIPDLRNISNKELCNLFKEKARGKSFILEVKSSQCKRYTDIQSIEIDRDRLAVESAF